MPKKKSLKTTLVPKRLVKSPLSSALKKAAKKGKRKDPLWKGPLVDGVTQSMLNDFWNCRERFRIKYILGLRPTREFEARIEYGQMWHTCEEAFALMPNEWPEALLKYATKLCKKYPLQQEQIQHWYNVCKTQFPIYIDHWKKQKIQKEKKHLLQEETFNVPYELPSGRVVKLRGKWDGVSLQGKGKNAGIYLEEHKTKSDIKEEQLKNQLQFDLQTMIYLIALSLYNPSAPRKGFAYDIKGINYNVIRRPLAGGKGTIRQHKPSKSKPRGESKEEFYKRVDDIIREDPSHYFMRWQVEVSPSDIERFKREFLNPILEQLCNWYEVVVEKSCLALMTGDFHYRTPYGIYNVLAERGHTELDEFLSSGSTVGLEQMDHLFGELR